MSTATFSLNDLADFLRRELSVDNYPATEQGGIYYPSQQPVKRVGLALEPSPRLYEWVAENQPDVLWMHRPWKLDLTSFPPELGILAHHLPFDETLTMGYNAYLAQQMGATGPLQPIGYKQSVDDSTKKLPPRPIGMLIDVIPQEFDSLLDTIKTLFDGYERAEAGYGTGGWQPDSCRIAVVGAMTDALIREAHERGANLYLTGAYRKPGQQAVDDTGMAVIAIGHRRSEEWGLRALSDLIKTHCPVECLVYEADVAVKA